MAIMQESTVNIIYLYGFNNHDPKPMDCPLCKLSLRHGRDDNSYSEVGVCYECKLTFYYTFGEEWHKGKRPDGETIASYIETRLKRPSLNLR